VSNTAQHEHRETPGGPGTTTDPLAPEQIVAHDGPSSDGRARPDVSIIIVNWNTRQLLRECLQSIDRHAAPVRAEVIVIDNNSADGSAAMVAEDFQRVLLIRNTENLGFAVANNQGIAIARGRYVLLLNSDTQVLDGTLAKSVAFADAHPDAAVVGCRTVFPDGRLQINCYLLPGLLNLLLTLTHLAMRFPRSRFFGRRRLTWWDYDTVKEVEGVAGCFMLTRAEAIRQVGPLAEDYFMYSEDTDWCWRFAKAGWKVMYTPEPLLIHVRAASSDQCETDMLLLQRRALLMFLERKNGRLTRWIANAMFLGGSLLRLPLLWYRRKRGGPRSKVAQQDWRLSTATARFHLLGRLPADLQARVDAGGPRARPSAVAVSH
jgi:GT2 family glycosyltransferase